MTGGAQDFNQSPMPPHVGEISLDVYPPLGPSVEDFNFGYAATVAHQQSQEYDAGAFDLAPSYDAPDVGTAAAFQCTVCHRLFIRQCDLNKHVKGHSRPYKCSNDDCEYHELGWPTEKELERHVNDKHTAKPQLFVCHHSPCTHTSKRESNLKQHMEKAHGWEYKRSRAIKPYRCPIAECEACSNPNETRMNHLGVQLITPPTPSIRVPPHGIGDFPLFPDHTEQHVQTPAADALGGQAPSQPGWDSFVPWESPPTRGENITKCLHSVDAMIRDQLPPDPRLAQIQYPPLARAAPGARFMNTEGLSPYMPGQGHSRTTSASPAGDLLGASEDQWSTARNYTASKDGESPHKVTSGWNAAGTPQSDALSTSRPLSHMQASSVHSTTLLKRKGHDGEDDDDGSGPPAKRPKPLPDDEFDDDQMPCPFRHHDPEHFDRENEEKFSPCHTRHKDISTIVRHMGRPAHSLDVAERWVSSFDTGHDKQHCLEGAVCRRCWRIFRVQDDFTNHISQMCSKISRGKREKFDLLFRTFCVEPQDPMPPPPPVPESRQPSYAPESEVIRLTGPSASPYLPDLTTLPPMAASVSAQADAVRDFAEDSSTLHRRPQAGSDLPPREAIADLQARVAALEKYCFPNQHHPSRPTAEARGAAPGGIVYTGTTAGPSRQNYDVRGGEGGGADARTEDQESLVSGMNSRPTNVDRSALPFEAQRTLSGLSSSSGRSSVRHVPLDPQRFQAAAAAAAAAMTAGAAAAATQVGRGTVAGEVQTLIGQEVPPYSDSGYGTGSIEAASRLKKSVTTELATVGEEVFGQEGEEEEEEEKVKVGTGGAAALEVEDANADFFRDPSLMDFDDINWGDA